MPFALVSASRAPGAVLLVALAIVSPLARADAYDVEVADGQGDVYVDASGVLVATPEIDFTHVRLVNDGANVTMTFSLVDVSFRTFADELGDYVFTFHDATGRLGIVEAIVALGSPWSSGARCLADAADGGLAQSPATLTVDAQANAVSVTCASGIFDGMTPWAASSISLQRTTDGTDGYESTLFGDAAGDGSTTPPIDAWETPARCLFPLPWATTGSAVLSLVGGVVERAEAGTGAGCPPG